MDDVRKFSDPPWCAEQIQVAIDFLENMLCEARERYDAVGGNVRTIDDALLHLGRLRSQPECNSTDLDYSIYHALRPFDSCWRHKLLNQVPGLILQLRFCVNRDAPKNQVISMIQEVVSHGVVLGDPTPPEAPEAFGNYPAGGGELISRMDMEIAVAVAGFRDRVRELRGIAFSCGLDTDPHDLAISALSDRPFERGGEVSGLLKDAKYVNDCPPATAHDHEAEGIVHAWRQCLVMFYARQSYATATTDLERADQRGSFISACEEFKDHIDWRAANPADLLEPVSSRADMVFKGVPAPSRFLSHPYIRRGSLTLLAALPGRMKSAMALSLGLRVAGHARDMSEGHDKPLISLSPLGGTLDAEYCGPVLFVSAEDDRDEVHRRLNAIDPDGKLRKRSPLWIKSATDLTDITLIRKGRSGYEVTTFYAAVRQWLDEIFGQTGEVALLILDPGHSLIDDELDAGAVKFLNSVLSALAVKYGMGILLLMHLPKASHVGEEYMVAKSGPRGSAAWTGRARCALISYRPSDKEAKAVADMVECRPDEVQVLEVLKVNYRVPDEMMRRVFVRRGLTLEDMTDRVRSQRTEDWNAHLLELLVPCIIAAHESGDEFTKTGTGGVYSRRDELPKELSELSRRKLEGLVDLALVNKRLDIVDHRLGLITGGTKKGTKLKEHRVLSTDVRAASGAKTKKSNGNAARPKRGARRPKS